jgi:DNA-binding NtrC family response regulator
MQALIRWKWPGNIRELENFLERAVILTRGPILHVPLAELAGHEEVPEVGSNKSGIAGECSTLEEVEREYILRILRMTKGQIGGSDGAAERLGVPRTTLSSMMKKLGIERSDYF